VKTTSAAASVDATDVGWPLRYAKAPRPTAAQRQRTVTFLMMAAARQSRRSLLDAALYEVGEAAEARLIRAEG
jgi:hypothetical protein